MRRPVWLFGAVIAVCSLVACGPDSSAMRADQARALQRTCISFVERSSRGPGLLAFVERRGSTPFTIVANDPIAASALQVIQVTCPNRR